MDDESIIVIEDGIDHSLRYQPNLSKYQFNIDYEQDYSTPPRKNLIDQLNNCLNFMGEQKNSLKATSNQNIQAALQILDKQKIIVRLPRLKEYKYYYSTKINPNPSLEISQISQIIDQKIFHIVSNIERLIQLNIKTVVIVQNQKNHRILEKSLKSKQLGYFIYSIREDVLMKGPISQYDHSKYHVCILIRQKLHKEYSSYHQSFKKNMEKIKRQNQIKKIWHIRNLNGTDQQCIKIELPKIKCTNIVFALDTHLVQFSIPKQDIIHNIFHFKMLMINSIQGEDQLERLQYQSNLITFVYFLSKEDFQQKMYKKYQEAFLPQRTRESYHNKPSNQIEQLFVKFQRKIQEDLERKRSTQDPLNLLLIKKKKKENEFFNESKAERNLIRTKYEQYHEKAKSQKFFDEEKTQKNILKKRSSSRERPA